MSVKEKLRRGWKVNFAALVSIAVAFFFTFASMVYFGAILHAHVVDLSAYFDFYSTPLPKPLWEYYLAAPLCLWAGWFFTGVFGYFWDDD